MTRAWPREFRLPVYGGQVAVHNSAADFDADRNRRNPGAKPLRPAAGRTCQITEPGGAATYLVGIFDGKISTAAHEMGHVVFLSAERAGIDLRHDSGESACSLLSDLIALAGLDDTPAPAAWMVIDHSGHRAVYLDRARALEAAAHRRATIVDLVPGNARPAG